MKMKDPKHLLHFLVQLEIVIDQLLFLHLEKKSYALIELDQ